MMKKIVQKIIMIAGGAMIGFANGFFGGGGGMLCVPLLEKGLKEETRRAHATAILIILPICIASMIVYLKNGFFETTTVLYCGAGVLAGGIAGAFLLKILPPKITALVFSLLMLAAGIRLVI